VGRMTRSGNPVESQFVDAFAAGRLLRTLDTLHSVAYFVPEADEKFGELGLDSRKHYFAGPIGADGRRFGECRCGEVLQLQPTVGGAGNPGCLGTGLACGGDQDALPARRVGPASGAR